MNLYLIDGYGFVFRAYHSLPPLSSPDGTPVSAVYGFLNMLLKLLDSHQADMLAVALDSGGLHHRHTLYSDYKANRAAPPDDLKIQFPLVREALHAFNIKILENKEYEADDLIASCAVQAINAGHTVTIVSSDKDLIQLLNIKGINLYDPLKNKEITPDDVKNKFGVSVAQFTEALALIGDKSDNIPGIPGIGIKTAADLLTQYQSIQGIYDNIDLIKSQRIKKLLLDHKKSGELSLALVTLKSDIVLEENLEDLKINTTDGEKIFQFVQKFGFKSLLSKFAHLHDFNRIQEKQYQKLELRQISSFTELEVAMQHLSKVGTFALHITKDKLFLATHSLNCYIYIPQAQESLFQADSLFSLSGVLQLLQPLLEAWAYKKIFLHAKSMLKELKELNCNCVAFEDIALMSYLVHNKSQQQETATSHNTLIITGHDIIVSYYALLPQLQSSKMMYLYERIEKPLVKILNNMEYNGVAIDQVVLQNLSLEFKQRAHSIAETIYEIAGENFNIASPKQLGFFLFEKMQLSGGKKSKKTGNYSTDSDILESLACAGHQIADLILEWRHLTKLVNTYTDSLQKNISNTTGRLHTTFEMTTTATGRLSSRNPNLQNIPIKSKEGAKIRKAFIASPGHVIISSDYSQIELRLLAHIANIQELKSAFLMDRDIHTVTASEIFKIPQDQVTKDLRQKAKGINFGIIYGISPFGLARNIGITQSEAKQYMKYYFERYPGIKEYMENTIASARQHGFVETIMYRRCFLHDINSSNYLTKAFAERAAINAPLQGSAADIIKKSMAAMPPDITRYLTLQIHDELLFDVPKTIAPELVKLITTTMEKVVTLSVPLKVDVTISSHW